MPILLEPPETYALTHLKWESPEPGWLEFDAVMRQTVDHDGEVTEHPIDIGGSVTDHYRQINIPITLETIISNSPLSLPQTHTNGATRFAELQTVELTRPVFPGAPTQVGGFQVGLKQQVTISTINYDPGLDRVNAIYDELRAIQDQARVLTVSLYTIKGPNRGGVYDSMLLKRFSFDQDPAMDNAVNVTLELRQVRFATAVEDQQVNIPKKPRSNTSTDAGKQGTTEKVDAKPVEKKASGLAQVAKWIAS